MTIETLIEEAAARGLLVNNLFQVATGRWQANLRTPDDAFIDFGRGRTAAEALRAALDKAPAAPGMGLFG